MGRRNPPAVLCYLLPAAVGGLSIMGNAHAPPPQQLTSTVSRTVSIVITVAISAFFVLVFFCVLVNQCRRSEDDGEGGGQGSNGRRRRGLDRAAVAALPIVPYVEIRKHKSGVLECAVCLTEFDGGDDLRLLPQCSHAFHPDCIDPWLEGHVACPLCRANVEKQPAPSPALALSSSPETEPQTPEAVAVRLEVESDEDERREEAVELERLRSVRQAARMPRSHSTGHSLSTTTSAPAPAEVGDDHERFTVRLPPHVREEVLKSRQLRHSTSLGGSSCEGSSRGDGGGSWHDARRWPSFLARTVSWARGGGEGSVRRGGVGAGTGTKGTAVP